MRVSCQLVQVAAMVAPQADGSHAVSEVGDDRTVPLDQCLADHPHPTYVDMVERMRDLAFGPHPRLQKVTDVILGLRRGAPSPPPR
jgi:hypothetical protein